ncbi:hypothetical protein ACFYVR_15335 [Rhodococcus sp. NPDC003318]|uniref:hypothetical protein n=1 Tax=Rhodococcus sp. NPDC003318 TaxID=3364503 RepID=UPI00368D75B4
MSESPTPPSTPTTVRWAGGLVAFEGALAVVVAIVLVVRGLLGHDGEAANPYGTAAWFVILGGAVLAAGLALLRGRRWGRAIAVVAQLLLLPVVWSLLTDSHQPILGVLCAVIVVPALAFLFAGPTSRWMAQEYGGDTADRD